MRTDPLEVRPPAVAGYFYPDDPGELRASVESLLATAAAGASASRAAPRALIAPHAGYVYSGGIAASAYREILEHRSAIRRVIVLGPSHRVPLMGAALPGARAFRTPLGEVHVDLEACARLAQVGGVRTLAAAHAEEHALEVQLPFLQLALAEFALVPLVVGTAPPFEIAAILDAFWDDPATLTVVSTDLSHYHEYAVAQRIDAETLRAIERRDAGFIGPERACGCRPLNGLLHLAAGRGHAVRILAACNSGDTAGDRASVVGYAAGVVT